MGFDLKLVCLDLDGVIYRGDVLIKGADLFVKILRKKGIEYVFVSNSTLFSRLYYTKKLNRLGIHTTRDQVITAAYATYKYIEAEVKDREFTVFLLGENGLKRELSKLKCRFISPNSTERSDYVVVALDRKITYPKLCKATWDIMDGSRFIAVNNDALWPVENGFMPGVGVFVSALKTATNREPYVVGKPNTFMLEIATNRFKVNRNNVLMVGDKLDSDILMGKRAGVKTALVLTGVTSQEDINKISEELKPDIIAKDLMELAEILGLYP